MNGLWKFGALFFLQTLPFHAHTNAIPSFSEFESQTSRTPSGTYVVDGDLPIVTLDGLYEYYKLYYEIPDSGTSDSSTLYTVQSLVKVSNGARVIWDSTRQHNLTYCIQKNGPNGFGANYSIVVNAMNSAARDWEASAYVDFKHIVAEDEQCSESQNVLFKVFEDYATWQGNDKRAAAFFPDDPPYSRILYIAADMPRNSPLPISITGLLRHELGHILGLVHEQARHSFLVCKEYGWEALTDYDLDSVMHYRGECGNRGDMDYFLTRLDKKGIGMLYPFPVAKYAPEARIHQTGPAYIGEPTYFDATASNDVDGTITKYSWSFGDNTGKVSATPVVTHVYKSIGSYIASLTVTDDDEQTSSTANIVLDVKLNPALVVPIYYLLLQ